MELVVNQTRYRLVVDPGRMLLWVLRDEPERAGTILGCGEGGACTVLIDGAAIRSCVTRVSAAAGKQITTIEGLSQNGKLHPLQEAFIEAEALQCGYCTPGMILASVALLKKTPQPTESEIRTSLEGNVCRCGTYPRIIIAVKSVSARNAALQVAAGQHA